MTFLCPVCHINTVDEPDEYCFTCAEDLISEAFHRASEAMPRGKEMRGIPVPQHDALIAIQDAARHVVNAGNAMIRGLAINALRRALTTYDRVKAVDPPGAD